ncbi:MAG: hypothetical protein GY716_08920 [bacterium]|nr:hypothetical protein [bacterium]
MRILIACTDCKRQFDASQLDAGSFFHCVCGAFVEVHRPEGHDAAVVRCSSCGAPRDEGSNSCTHCGSGYTLHERDLHTICPECMARVSDRARFCHHCATPLIPQGSAGSPTEIDCPACGDKHRLNSRGIGDPPISTLECPGCAGLWLGGEAFRLVVDRSRDVADVTGVVAPNNGGAAAAGLPPSQSGPAYRSCPECGELMHRKNFGKRSGVIIDTCRNHGLWFDSQELERILHWIRDGNEQRANEIEAERARDAERDARRKKNISEAVGLAKWDQEPRGRHAGGDFPDLLGSLLDFLRY